ncbi:MAG: PIN domain-containing protein [Pseudomonadota bacterium]
MEPMVAVLLETLTAQRAVLAPFSAEIAQEAGLLDWPHRDPFDRILAATALMGSMDFISADPAFDAVPGLRRIW